jgi:hypothetical protein
MTNRLENTRLESATLESAGPRRLACSRCGTAFTCDVGGSCWCTEETFILPMPADGGDCLCRDCLRKMAAEQVG